MPGNPSMKSIQESIDNFRNEHKITVDQIQKDLLEIKDTIIQNLLDENKQLKDRVKALEDQADEHDEQLIEIEKHSHGLEQYTRRNNLEINGIPNDISDENLEMKCIEVLHAVDISVDTSEIEACHRLPPRKNDKTKTVLLKFTNRKFVDNACSKDTRNKLKTCNKVDLGLDENTEVFFNENLSPYFQQLSWMCRVLKRKKRIFGSWFRDGKLFYRESDNSKPKRVMHWVEIKKKFPGIKEFEEM